MDIETKLREAQIEHMVQRFLRWRLPENFNPDGGIIFSHTSGGRTNQPVGTNLFDYQQAKAMVIHMLEGLPDEQADTIATLRKQVSEHKRLKNQLVLKAYPAMDAIEEIAPGFKSAVHFVRNVAMDMERDYPEICQAEKVFARTLAALREADHA